MDDAEHLGIVRAELRFELGLLHDRVNALLSGLGLLLALLAWPGVMTTAQLVLAWTDDQAALLAQQGTTRPGTASLPWRSTADGALQVAQRRSLLFFRSVPPVFAVVWTALTVVALTLTR